MGTTVRDVSSLGRRVHSFIGLRRLGIPVVICLNKSTRVTSIFTGLGGNNIPLAGCRIFNTT